jgi:cell division protein FtsA
MTQAEDIKIEHGNALEAEVSPDEFFNVHPFGERDAAQVNRQELAMIIEARAEEMFSLVLQEIKRSGYDGLLPAGMVLTGGVSALPSIKHLAHKVLGVPVRIAMPENLIGMVDKLDSPAYSTSVGLIRWAFLMSEFSPQVPASRREYPVQAEGMNVDRMRSWLRRLLP